MGYRIIFVILFITLLIPIVLLWRDKAKEAGNNSLSRTVAWLVILFWLMVLVLFVLFRYEKTGSNLDNDSDSEPKIFSPQEGDEWNI